ncbi:histidine kinase [Corallococcus sp. 4LFB]|uniref:histidine kinase n=1 Tax=Corallococcus sp. 4LFB TaxID=3383249 RepID=UPI003974F481
MAAGAHRPGVPPAARGPGALERGSARVLAWPPAVPAVRRGGARVVPGALPGGAGPEPRRHPPAALRGGGQRRGAVGGLRPAARHAHAGHLPVGAVQPGHLRGLFLVAGWGLGRDIGFEETLAHERARAARFAWEAEQAQLLALRSHLDPHFLFNTLNAIAEWCREDGAVAEAAVLRLSTMLRSVLAGVRSVTWPLSQELELMRTLFDLHLLRDPDLFQLRMDVADGLADVPVPPLLLLPLAENAVKHGPAAGHRGPLTVEVVAREGAVGVSIDNPARPGVRARAAWACPPWSAGWRWPTAATPSCRWRAPTGAPASPSPCPARAPNPESSRERAPARPHRRR